MADRGLHWLRAHPLVVAVAVLVGLYFWSYLGQPALPGNSAQFPQGWWGWFDQGKTLESAGALAMRDLSPGRHWYPLGYALLGAPFIGLGFRMHPFAFVDLACLLAAFGGFVAFAGSCGVSRGVAAALFVGALAWDQQVLGEWAIPWNSTPAAAAIWLLLGQCGRWLRGVRRPVLTGVLAGCVPWFRPTEAAPVAACVLWLLVADWRAGGLRLRSVAGLALGGLLALAPQVALHLAIYGVHASEYMVASRQLGFTLHDFGWKAYVVLADPGPWFTDGAGLLRRLPWVAVGLAGFVPALVRGRAAGLLAGALAVHFVVYASYVDLLPTGLWRFNNVHYWKWAVPGFGLLAWLLVRELLGWQRAAPPYAAVAGVVAAAAVSLVRIVPGTAGVGEAAKMLEYHGDAPGFDQSYFGQLVLHDPEGALANVSGFRALPVPGGMRVIGLSRDIGVGAVMDPAAGLAPGLLAGTPVRYGERVRLGWPCWLPLARCGPRSANGLLPP